MARNQRLNPKRIIELRQRLPQCQCACGCGMIFWPFDERGRHRKYIRNHQTKSIVLRRKRPYGPSPTKGKKASDETRRKLSESHKGQRAWNAGLRGATVAWNKGKRNIFSHSLETRKRISTKLRGEKSHLWRGGHDERCPRIKTIEWKLLRKEIYKRDNWKCQVCQKPAANRIQCHHIIPVRYGGSDDPNNLVTVCLSCHRKQEHRFGDDSYYWGLFPQSATHE